MKWLAILPLLFTGCITTDEFTKMWLKHVEKSYNWIQADNEAMKYKDGEEEARKYLQDLRTMTDPYAISQKIVKDGFDWRAEVIDFTNYPWVTIAKKRGDCDDFAALWDATFKYRGKTERVYVAKRDHSSAHAMILYNDGVKLYILSNQYVLSVGGPDDGDKLIKLFYKEETGQFIRY
jgi:hypothetical protein